MALIWELLLLSASVLTTIKAQEPLDIRLPPSITAGPDKIYLYRDKIKVSLPCEAVGEPQPTYTWFKNGAPLSETGIVYPDPTSGSIDIGQATKDNEGYYQCFASNKYGRTMSNVTLLRVASLDPYEANAPKVNYTVAANNNLRLPCFAPASIPSATYFWSYNTTSLSQTDVILSRRVQIDFNGDLCFASVASNEPTNRLYRCNVYNYVMSTTPSGAYSRIMLSGIVNNVAPALMFSSPPTVIALQSEQTKLRCFFSGTDNNGAGLITYSWTYNGRSGLPLGWTFSDGEASSPASGTAPSDAGIYKCFGYNTQGQANATIELIVEAIPDFGPPENQPHDMNVTEGDTITISCQADAVPDANIRWFKNATEFGRNSLPPKFDLSEDLMTLTISDICKDCTDGTSDLMNIQCNASNIHGYSFAQGYVNVLLAPTISSQSVTENWSPYATYKFECASTCDDSTPCTTEWTFMDAPVEESDALFVDDQGSLNIDTANDTDAGSSRIGTYTCTVSNTYSDAAINATIEGDGDLGTASLWWVGLLVALLVLLLLLLVLLCCFFCVCRDGKSYPVDKRERDNGNNPVEDLRKLAIHEYVPNRSAAPNVYLPVYTASPLHTQPPPDNDNFTTGAPAAHTVYVEEPGNVYLPNYAVPPSREPPKDRVYYVEGAGYQTRSLSHGSQGEVFSPDIPNEWHPYDGVPQSEV